MGGVVSPLREERADTEWQGEVSPLVSVVLNCRAPVVGALRWVLQWPWLGAVVVRRAAGAAAAVVAVVSGRV